MGSTDAEQALVAETRRVPERGLVGLSEEAWAEARRRAGVIGPLAELERVSAVAAREAGARLGLSERTVYALVRHYRASGRLLSSLAPRRSTGGRGKGRLSAAAERVVAEAIRDQYLTRQKRRVEAVVREVGERCRALGLKPPSPNTVRGRVRRVRADLAASRRAGVRSPEARRLEPVVGAMPVPERPMEVLQMDHTLVDLITVDEARRKPVGRPWLSVAIDVHSRCIAGLHLSYEAPSATSVGLCLTHAALGKEAYLCALDLDPAAWPVQGRPAGLPVDNGAEFHSEALARGCEQHGIELRYRPPGAPHHGGIVERLIGTLMGLIHELPGTTFSHPAARGAYDSDASACLTLAELERWLVLAIVGPYHNRRHGGIGTPTLARWRQGVADRGLPPAVADGTTFLVDFLPIVRRRITREGFVVDHVAYFGDALRPWISQRDEFDRFVIRRDPRDLSRIWVLDPTGHAYVEVPCSRQERPRITLFEHRQARAGLRAEGRAQVDEEAIFRAVAAQRELAQEAATRTRSARRRLARTAQVPSAPWPSFASLTVDGPDEEMVKDAEPFPMERWR